MLFTEAAAQGVGKKIYPDIEHYGKHELGVWLKFLNASYNHGKVERTILLLTASWLIEE